MSIFHVIKKLCSVFLICYCHHDITTAGAYHRRVARQGAAAVGTEIRARDDGAGTWGKGKGWIGKGGSVEQGRGGTMHMHINLR